MHQEICPIAALFCEHPAEFDQLIKKFGCASVRIGKRAARDFS
jgi:hypothetical protein